MTGRNPHRYRYPLEWRMGTEANLERTGERNEQGRSHATNLRRSRETRIKKKIDIRREWEMHKRPPTRDQEQEQEPEREREEEEEEERNVEWVKPK